MKNSLFLFTSLFAFALAFNASAQVDHSFSTTPVVDALGRPVAVSTYMKVTGSPYIIDEWLPGKVVTNDDKVYKKMLLKYNISTDMLTFVYHVNDDPLRFPEPVKRFTLNADHEITFANTFPKIDGNSTSAYYEVIADGNTMLLKHYKQTIRDVRDSNNLAMVDGKYVNKATYYVYKDKKMYRVKLNEDAIMGVLSDKAPALNTYLAKEQLNFDQETDLKKLFDYYNTLK